MENQELQISEYVYALGLMIVLALVTIGFNGYCLWALFCRKASKCSCDCKKNELDPEKDTQAVDNKTTDLQGSDSVEQATENNATSSTENLGSKTETTQVSKPENSKSRKVCKQQSSIVSKKVKKSIKKTEMESIETDNLEREMRKKEMEQLVKKMEDRENEMQKKEKVSTDAKTKCTENTEYKSLPPNVNMLGSTIVPTVWKENERMIRQKVTVEKEIVQKSIKKRK